MSDFFEEIENVIETTEADVVTWCLAIKQGASVVASDIQAGLKWVASQTPTIVADIQETVSIVEQLGLANVPQVSAAVAAADLAVTGLDAFAAQENSGTGEAQALVSGYVAVKQAQSAVTAAKAAAVAAPSEVAIGS